jgi:hypothetical protein
LTVFGRLPWTLAAFMGDAHRLGVLRRNGATYQFRHLELQLQLAGAVRGGRVSEASEFTVAHVRHPLLSLDVGWRVLLPGSFRFRLLIYYCLSLMLLWLHCFSRRAYLSCCSPPCGN